MNCQLIVVYTSKRGTKSQTIIPRDILCVFGVMSLFVLRDIVDNGNGGNVVNEFARGQHEQVVSRVSSSVSVSDNRHVTSKRICGGMVSHFS